VSITTLIILFAKEIVQIIYSSTYQSAAYFLSIYSTLYLLVGIGYLTLQSLFNGLGKTKTAMKISLIAFAIFFLLSPLHPHIQCSRLSYGPDNCKHSKHILRSTRSKKQLQNQTKHENADKNLPNSRSISYSTTHYYVNSHIF
jgi:hypothetical protein